MGYATLTTPTGDLQILRPGVIPISQSPTPEIPPNVIPVATLSLQDIHNFYNCYEGEVADLIWRNLIVSSGHPEDYANCYVDLEDAARVHTLWLRGKCLGWAKKVTIERILTPEKDEARLKTLLARFMQAHLGGRGHQGAVVGYRAPLENVEISNNISPIHEWQNLISYREGK